MDMRNVLKNSWFIFFLIYGCTTAQKIHHTPLRVDDAYYYSWFVTENERGTYMEIHVTEMRKDISYDSLIFRGGAFPVSAERSGRNVTIMAEHATVGFEHLNLRRPVDLPDQLVYSWMGQKRSILLDELRNDGIRYLKRE